MSVDNVFIELSDFIYLVQTLFSIIKPSNEPEDKFSKPFRCNMTDDESGDRMGTYIDLHMHTLASDGIYAPTALIGMARAEGIAHLAITDHNRIHSNIGELRGAFPDVEIISGSEMSAAYRTQNGEKKEIHIVGLYLKQTDRLKHFLQKSCNEGCARITKMLEKLALCGVNLHCNSFKEVQKKYFPERKVLGRMQIAEILVKEGYAASVNDAMHTYIGDYGKRLAYVPNEFIFADMKDVVTMIHEVSGVAILAHPFSYHLDDGEVKDLISAFKEVNGDGMEVWYGRYKEDMCNRLQALADKYNLLASCGSDYHGNRENDCLNHCFSNLYLDAICERHLKYIREKR